MIGLAARKMALCPSDHGMCMQILDCGGMKVGKRAFERGRYAPFQMLISVEKYPSLFRFAARYCFFDMTNRMPPPLTTIPLYQAFQRISTSGIFSES